MSAITLALQAVEKGTPGASDRLMELVYTELHQLATARMALERAGTTLQPTALVHEAWLRLGGDRQPSWQNRAHFFGAAAEAMRRVLIGYARRRRAKRRGSGQVHISLDDFDVIQPERDAQLLALDEALTKFAQVDPAKAELVKLRYFVGLSIEEAAQTLGISPATAKRWWAFSRARLHRDLARDDAPPDRPD